jgi:hypothetical protein
LHAPPTALSQLRHHHGALSRQPFAGCCGTRENSLDSISPTPGDLPVVLLCRSSRQLIPSPNHQQSPAHPVPTGGAYRDRHGRWARDAMDAGSARDECAGHGRRSRSVLIPRRWYQVLEKLALLRDDGDNKARSPGRLRRKSLKPSRRECRKRFGEPVVTNSYACFICMRGCGCAKHPAFPAPSPRKRLAFVATLRDKG